MNKAGILVLSLLIAFALSLTQGQAQTTPLTTTLTTAQTTTLTAKLERQIGQGLLLDLIFLKDNKTIVSSGTRGLTYWDVATQKLIRTIDMDMDGYVMQITVSENGKWLATASSSGIGLYEAATGKLISKLFEISSQVVTFSPDNKWLATGSDDGIVRLWNMATLKASALAEFYIEGMGKGAYQVKHIGFDRLSSFLICDAAPTFAKNYNAAFFATRLDKRQFERVKGEVVEVVGIFEFRSYPTNYAFSPDNKLIFGEGTLYSYPEFDQLYEFKDYLYFSPDWKIAVLKNGTIVNPANYQSILSLSMPGLDGVRNREKYIGNWAFSADGRYLIARLLDQRMLIYDAKRFVLLNEIKGHQPPMTTIAMHPKLPIAALWGRTNELRFVHLETGEQQVQTIDPALGLNLNLPILFSPQGQILTSSTYAFNFTPMNIDTDRSTMPVELPDVECPRAWTHDETQLLFHCDNMIYSKATGLYAKATNTQATSTQFQAREFASTEGAGLANITTSKDGKYVAVAGQDGVARVYDYATQKLVSRLIHPSSVIDVAFSSNSKELYTRSVNGVSKWSVGTWNEIGKLILDRKTTAFALGNSNLIALAIDLRGENVWLVSTETMKIVGTIRNNSSVFALGFSADDQRLIVSYDDANIRIWRLQR